MAINGISGVNASAISSSFSSQQVSGTETSEDNTPAVNGNNSGATTQGADSGSDDSLGANAANTLMQASEAKAMGDAQLIASAAQNSTPQVYGPNKPPDAQQQVMQLTNNAATAANTAVMQVNVLA